MNTFGKNFRVTTFGESHGKALGVTIDGCPAGYKLDIDRMQTWLARRKPGQSALTSPRSEADEIEIVSGLNNNITLGTPLTILIRNRDFKPEHYKETAQAFRPSHADYTTFAKYGIAASSGGGRASARETVGRVAAAAVAEQILGQRFADMRIVAFVDTVKNIAAGEINENVTRDEIDQSTVRCPDKAASEKMQHLILRAKEEGDTVGGTIRCFITRPPVGLGEPVFGKFEAKLARAMLSLPATKGFEIGSGFEGTKLFGSEHNDEFYMEDGRVRTRTNQSGGIQGGISNGETISFRVAFKPVSTIFKAQKTVTKEGKDTTLTVSDGRHDPCVLPRAVPIVEAMATLVIMDCCLKQTLWQTWRGPHAQG
jgi:chorismate synthase